MGFSAYMVPTIGVNSHILIKDSDCTKCDKMPVFGRLWFFNQSFKNNKKRKKVHK